MFTGLIRKLGIVSEQFLTRTPARLTISCDGVSVSLGDSVAVNGVCLTVVTSTKDQLTFEIAEESLRRTTLGKLVIGDRVHLEPALKLGDSLDGHLLSGHVDGTVTLLKRTAEKTSERFLWELPKNAHGFIAEKGSIALDGVSLTVGEVLTDSFVTYLIPHTLEHTTFGALQVGAKVNYEIDLVARYVASLLQARSEKEAA